MPTYEYLCRDCGDGFDIVQSFKDESLTICPACGGVLRKVFAAPAISFKGSGFYATDSRKGSKSGSESKHDGSKQDSSKSDSKSDSSKGEGSKDTSSKETSSKDGSSSSSSSSSSEGGPSKPKETSSDGGSAKPKETKQT
jgi:putative FmdB family regulatory protein